MTETSARRHSRRFWKLSGVEWAAVVFLSLVLVAFTTFKIFQERIYEHLFFSQSPLAELESFREAYGPSHYSFGFEEWMVRDYFQDRRDGVFLDVGASHYLRFNNTYFLEKSLGWSGVAIDALDEFAADYAAHRPKTRFVSMFASDVADASVRFFVADENLVSSVSREHTARYGAPGQPRQVPTTTLTAVLDEAGIDRIDFMSMDIELAEPRALAGFDIDRFRPALVCIESHPEVRQQIMDYFDAHGYVVVGKYLRVDPHNLYFAPRTQRLDSSVRPSH